MVKFFLYGKLPTVTRRTKRAVCIRKQRMAFMSAKLPMLEMAERFRSHARETELPQYRDVMLRVALELETIAALRDTVPEPAYLSRPAGHC